MENCAPPRILAKLVYTLKRYLDDWIADRLVCPSNQTFNKAQLPLFMTIGTTGISNNDLAAKLNISKQATSKVIKELEANDLVKSEKSQEDARAVMLYLTDHGTCLYDHIKQQVEQREEDYKKVVGAKNYEITLDVLVKLTAYHEQQSKIALN